MLNWVFRGENTKSNKIKPPHEFMDKKIRLCQFNWLQLQKWDHSNLKMFIKVQFVFFQTRVTGTRGARDDQLTLFQPGKGRLYPPITSGTPIFFYFPASLQISMPLYVDSIRDRRKRSLIIYKLTSNIFATLHCNCCMKCAFYEIWLQWRAD